jgi:TatD DNase family protein
MLTDTHAHLDFPDFADELPQVIERAHAAGVTRILTIGTTLESSQRAVELARQYEGVYAVVGVHPNHAHEEPADIRTPLRELASLPKVVAIGEAGMDFHYLPGDDTAGAIIAAQAAAFKQQLDLAAELGLNVVVHQRDAWSETLEVLAPYTGRLRSVFHCFGGTLGQARELIAQGHMVSFTGLVTFKNAPNAHECAALLPADAFMVETDCPYLAPVPFRGKRCEPAYVRQVAENIAQRRGVTLEEVARQTEACAERFFAFHRK